MGHTSHTTHPDKKHQRMIDEVNAACEWGMARVSTGKQKNDEVKRLMFRDALRSELRSRFEGHWYPECPFRGSAFRSIVNDIRLDPALEAAATASGFDPARLPKVYMFVNPNEVKVRGTSCCCEGREHWSECSVCLADTLVFGRWPKPSRPRGCSCPLRRLTWSRNSFPRRRPHRSLLLRTVRPTSLRTSTPEHSSSRRRSNGRHSSRFG